MDFRKSLRFHIDNYDYMYRFDDNLTAVSNLALKIFTTLSYYSGLSYLTSVLVKKHIKNRLLLHQEIVIFVFSKNHFLVQDQLYKLGLDFPVYDLSFSKTPFSYPVKAKFISKMVMLWSCIASSGTFLVNIRKNSKDQIIAKNYLKFFKLSGYSLIYDALLSNSKGIVKFNDHIFNSMLLADMAKEKGVKTVYVQHAAASERFPALHHDLNVLFSQDSFDKYKIENDTVKTFQFVDVRMLHSNKFKQDIIPSDKKVLIASNLLDDFTKLEELVKELVDVFEIIIRPHPRDQRDFSIFEKMGDVKISSGTTIWEDMNDCAIVLCNESAVPLEVVYYNRRFYKVPLLSESLDSYMFIKKAFITKEFFDAGNLKQAILSNEVCTDKSKLSYFIGDMDNYKTLAVKLKAEIKELMG